MMKIRELKEVLTDLENQINSLNSLIEIHDLTESYANLIGKSGYFFSDFEPNDIYQGLGTMLGDIERIREDMENFISAHAEDMEL